MQKSVKFIILSTILEPSTTPFSENTKIPSHLVVVCDLWCAPPRSDLDSLCSRYDRGLEPPSIVDLSYPRLETHGFCGAGSFESARGAILVAGCMGPREAAGGSA